MVIQFSNKMVIFLSVLSISLLAGLVGCQSQEPQTSEVKKESPLEKLTPTARANFLKARIGALPEVPVPADNPMTPEKIDLGRHLFFDVRLSGDQKTSCASCHDPEKSWSDGRPQSVGVRNRRGRRNTLSLLNVAYYETLYWDGRASTLEEQALKALSNPEEMAGSAQNAVKAIGSSEGYRPLFSAAFGSEDVTPERIAQAIASFERTMVTGPSAFDRYLDGDLNAMTPEQIEGMTLFLTRAKCVECHRGPFLTNQEFTPGGIYVNQDWGRFNWSKQEYDRGDFRVPTLRNVALSSPYFHNGSEPSLEQAVFFRTHGRTRKDWEIGGSMLMPLFNDKELGQIAAFLEALSGELPKIEVARDVPK